MRIGPELLQAVVEHIRLLQDEETEIELDEEDLLDGEAENS